MNDETLRRAFRDVPVARLATNGSEGIPHVAPLWFVWLPDAVYLSTGIGSLTWTDAETDPRVGLVIDTGRDWIEWAGVRFEGTADLLAVDHPDVRDPMSAWHEKYRSTFAGDAFERFTVQIPALGFLRLGSSPVETWNHAAIAGPQARA